MNNKKNNQQQGFNSQNYGYGMPQQQNNQQEFPQSFINPQWPVQQNYGVEQNYGAEQTFNYPFYGVPQPLVENFQPPLPPSSPNQGNQQQQNSNRNRRGQNRQNFGNRGNNHSNNNRGNNNQQQQQFHNQNSQGMNQDRGANSKKRNDRQNNWRNRDEPQTNSWQQQQQHQPQQNQQFNRTPDQSESWQATRPPPPIEPQQVAPPQPTTTLSKEEIEFDEQFKKWEQEFTNWKEANVNHPDKEAYRQYEKQFEGVREKLLSRRNEMMKKKLEHQQPPPGPPKTAEQLKFESQWQAGPSTEAPKPPIVPPPPATKPPFSSSYQEKFDDDDHYDDANYEMPRKSFAFIGGSQIGSAFDEPSDHSFQNAFPVNTHPLSIPGLETVTREPAPPPSINAPEPAVIPVIDLDTESSLVPPMPIFNSNQPNRSLQDLKELLEEPGRHSRHPHILVIIRGPPGSGKSYIANLIMEKEIMHGNLNGFASLSIDKYVPNGPRATPVVDKFQNKLLHELRTMVGLNKYNFITIEVEGGTLAYYSKYSHVAGSSFKVYVIEIRQTFEACVKFNKHNRSIMEIQDTIEEMKRYPTPFKVQLLDPTSLILSTTLKKAETVNRSSDDTEKAGSGLSSTTDIMKLLQDQNVLNLVHSQLLPTPEVKSPTKAPIQPLMSLPSGSQQSEAFSASSQQKSFDSYPAPPDLRFQEKQNFGPYGLQPNNQNFQQGNKNNQHGGNFPEASGSTNFSQGGGGGNFGQGNSSGNFQQGSRDNFSQGNSGNFQQGNFSQGSSQSFGNNPNFQQGNTNFPRNNQDFQQSNYQPMNTNFQPNSGYSEEPQAGRSNPNVMPFDSCPTFTPAKIIDYKHVHMPTLSEQLMEFRVFRVIDYKHRTSVKIREFVKDIDPEKIKEKRKSVALRKKILEYLRNAEKPEDTVSNPKYPKNWEVVQKEERPKSGTKRGKKMTEKIRRVKVRKMNEASWMTAGYGSRPSVPDEEMELSDISSDEDFNVAQEKKKAAAPAKVEAVVPKTQPPAPVKEDPNPLFTADTTIPNFNAFNHPKITKFSTIWPERKNARRPGKILVILRGAPGSGKSHLAGLIKQKEIAMGFGGPRIVSINDYLEDEESTAFDAETLELYLNQMVKFMERTIREGHHTFIIVDAENTDLSFYEKFYQAGASKEFSVFTIELQQKLEYCLIQNIHGRSKEDIEKAIKELETNRIPADHNILIPSELYAEFKCLVNTKIKGDPVEADPKNDIMDVSDDSSLEWIDLDNSSSQQEKKFPVPIFNPNNQSSVEGLESILELPGRSFRPNKIMIILRGPPGVGKTHLSGLILKREESFGNLADKVCVSIDNYFVNPATMLYEFNQIDELKNKTSMLSDLIENCQKFNFIVVDAENSSLKDYEDVRKVGTESGFKCFAIELHLDADTCVKQNIHKRTLKEILEVLKVINENPIPSDHECLDATYLYSENIQEQADSIADAVPLKPALKLSEGVQLAVKRKIEAPAKLPEFNWHNRDHITPLRSFLESLEATSRVAIVLRGAPGSGKTYLVKLIEKCSRDCGVEQFKCISLENFVYGDDPDEKPMERLKEELEVLMQEAESKLIVIDADCCDHLNYMSVCDIAKRNSYACYTIEMIVDDDVCTSDDALAKNRLMQETPTPEDHNLLDPEHLYEEYKNILEDIESEEEDEETSFGPLKRTTVESKWDDEGDAGGDTVIERLDGTRNKTFERLTMANYLQTEDEWTMRPSQSGKKRVRWADIEEKKEQERMRDIGFIVGQTDWKRMTDTSDGRSALEKTKYIESRKNS